MPGARYPISLALMISLAMLLLLSFVAAPEISGLTATQNQNSSGQQAAQRRPLPKPPTGPRGFEQYKGNSARQIAGGATRGSIVNPRKPIAPLEGRSYEDRPFLAWEIAPGSKSYHLTIYEGDVDTNKSAQIVYETDVTTTELLYPKEAARLIPGKLYSWRVSTPTTTTREEGAVARFIILSGPEATEVKQALASAGLSMPRTPAERLDQARVFENYGVWYDALRIASELADNPNDKEALAYYEALLEKLENPEH